MTDQHQPFDDDPELYQDDPERQGGTTHGQDEADDRAALLDHGTAAEAAAMDDPDIDPGTAGLPPADDNR